MCGNPGNAIENKIKFIERRLACFTLITTANKQLRTKNTVTSCLRYVFSI